MCQKPVEITVWKMGVKSNSVVKLLLLFYILEAIRRQALQSGSSKSSKWVFLRAFFLKKTRSRCEFSKKNATLFEL